MIFAWIFFALGHSLVTDASEKTPRRLRYQIQSSQQWQADVKALPIQDGYEHYLLAEDPSIDLLFSFADEYIYSEFKKNPEDTFNQILRGKNLTQSLVSNHPIKMKNTRIKKQGLFETLSFDTTSQVGTQSFSTHEVYFLGPQTSLHATLRWTQNSKTGLLQMARQDFDRLQVDYRSSEEE